MKAIRSLWPSFGSSWVNSSTCLFGFLLATAYWPWITGAATTPRWLVLVGLLGLSLFAASNEGKKRDTAGLLGLAFVFWAVLTAAWSAAPEWWDAAWKLLLMVGLYMVGTRIADLRPLLVGCAAGVAVSSAIVVLERLGPLADPEGANPSGLFVNGLYLAEFAAMVVAGLLALGHRRWALLCAPALLLVTLPRGPLLALAAAGIAWLWSVSRRWALASILAVVAALPLAIWMRPVTVTIRIETWADMILGISVWGNGLGSYAAGAVVGADPLVRKTHANNDILEIAYECGVVGVILALGFVVALFWPRSSTVEHQPLLQEDHADGVQKQREAKGSMAGALQTPSRKISAAGQGGEGESESPYQGSFDATSVSRLRGVGHNRFGVRSSGSGAEKIQHFRVVSEKSNASDDQGRDCEMRREMRELPSPENRNGGQRDGAKDSAERGQSIGFDLSAAAATLIVIVFLVEGLVGFPLHMPATAGLFALAAGHLARR